MSLLIATGNYAGNSTSPRVIPVAFRPHWVLGFITTQGLPEAISRTTGSNIYSWGSGGGGASFVGAQIDAGNSFTLTTNARNSLGTNYHWVAFGGDDVESFGWTGNAADNRNIACSFQPNHIFGMSNTTTAGRGGRAWTSQIGGDIGASFGGSSYIADIFQGGGFTASSIQVGTLFNENTFLYHAINFREKAGYIAQGSYVGNGAASRAITTGFQPQFVWVKRKDALATQTGVFKSTLFAASTAWDFSTSSTTYITAFTATGFTVGNHANVNGNLNNYYWMAVQNFDMLPFDDPILPSVPSGGGANSLPFSGYTQYKTLRALTDTFNNLVIGP